MLAPLAEKRHFDDRYPRSIVSEARGFPSRATQGEGPMGLRIYYDGLNLALQRGTGIATYTRMLMNKARDLGHSVSAVYSVPIPPAKNPALREISFYDPHHGAEISRSWLALA